MPDKNQFSFGDDPDSSSSDFKPWVQRPAPGMGGSSDSNFSASSDEPSLPERIFQEMRNHNLQDVVDRQADLAYYPMLDRQSTAETDQQVKVSSNQEVWQLFISEQLYDTRRVTLEHFHLFEWFPLAPGRFHTAEAHQNRLNAYELMFQTQDGRSYFNPYGKADMIRGGIGAVRLRPRLVGDEAHYFMTASSTGVCHEGFPVLLPRRFYGPLKGKMLRSGAVPLTLSGEMRYLLDDVPTFFEGNREIPHLYLHVDQIEELVEPRKEVDEFSVSAAVSFVGEFDGREGYYATYATFDPADQASLMRAVQWLKQFYVADKYKGIIVTDFDEVQPRFSGTVFGLPDLMAGKLNQKRVTEFLRIHGFDEKAGQPFYLIYKEINTQGGAYIDGNVETGGGDFIGRDKSAHGGE